MLLCLSGKKTNGMRQDRMWWDGIEKEVREAAWKEYKSCIIYLTGWRK